MNASYNATAYNKVLRWYMRRYDIINEKNPREIVLLRGNGCKWRKCAFCDYHTDFSKDEEANYKLNKEVLSKVTGKYGRLEIINSGSFVDFNAETAAEIRRTAETKNIHSLHFECHWMHRDKLEEFRRYFNSSGIEVIYKIGIETFDIPFREDVLKKGMGNAKPAEIAEAGFGEINLLCGIAGQTAETMRTDIKTGLRYFDRVCVNLMTANTTDIGPAETVMKQFRQEIYPEYKDNRRVDILLENTDFGVGTESEI